ncbi:MAG: DUF969 domain-containing protein [Brevinema sp.]
MQLIGVFIIMIGFMLKLDAIAIVVIAGITTGLAVGMDCQQIFSILGQSFVDTRYMSLFLITLPIIGLLERNGLRNTSMHMIQKIKNATTDTILSLYMIIRVVTSIFGVRISGHVQFIRPIIYPMAESAATLTNHQLTEKQKDNLKALACAIDNYGNFFAQNGFVANAGVLLIVGTLHELGIQVQNFRIAQVSLIMAVVATILVVISNKTVVKNILEKNK